MINLIPFFLTVLQQVSPFSLIFITGTAYTVLKLSVLDNIVKHSQRQKGQKKFLISKSEMRKKESSNE